MKTRSCRVPQRRYCSVPTGFGASIGTSAGHAGVGMCAGEAAVGACACACEAADKF